MNCLNKLLVTAGVGARAKIKEGARAETKMGPAVGLRDGAGPKKEETLPIKRFRQKK